PSEEQRRHDRARLKIEVLYVLGLPEIESRIPRSLFNDLVARYLGDHLPAKDVEDNSSQLELLLLQQQRNAVGATLNPAALRSLLPEEADRSQGRSEPASSPRIVLDGPPPGPIELLNGHGRMGEHSPH